MSHIIVVGTDTNVGKTVLSALLMSAMQAYSYWKPIQSGLLEETDTEIVARYSSCDTSRIIPEAYRLSQPLSPHLSSRIDGVVIEMDKLQLPSQQSLIVETAGGVLVPINDRSLQIDLLQMWAKPVVIAARSSLGTINHTLMTLEALRRKNIDIVGVVMIGDENAENEKAIEQYGSVKIVGRIPPLKNITADVLRDVYKKEFSAFEQLL